MEHAGQQPPDVRELAEKVRQSCIQAAKDAFEDASLNGLCRDGALEAAIGAMQSINVEELVTNYRMPYR